MPTFRGLSFAILAISLCIATPPALALAPNQIPVQVRSISPEHPLWNQALVTIQVCNQTGHCVDVPNVKVDTGSSGLRLAASALQDLQLDPAPMPGPAVPDQTWAECLHFSDEYAWGTVRLAQLHFGTLAPSGEIPVEVVGDAAVAALAKTYCTTDTAKDDTGKWFEASHVNGILGISNARRDCGMNCVNKPAEMKRYFLCNTANCQVAPAPLAIQVANPAASMPAPYNDGTVLSLPATDPDGTSHAEGTLTFGISADPQFHEHTVLMLPTAAPKLGSSVDGMKPVWGLVDSGTNKYLINLDPVKAEVAGLRLCGHGGPAGTATAYCPLTPVKLNATFVDGKGKAAMTKLHTSIMIGNAARIVFEGNAAASGFAGQADKGAMNIYGLPFFFGRDVAVGLPSPEYPHGFLAF